MVEAASFRGDFPILQRRIHGQPLAYLDSAATTQKPRAVIEALTVFYEQHNANVHRGVYTLSEEASALYESARAKVARHLGADSPRSIVFTRGTTEALNLVAAGWAGSRLRPGDEIVATEVEHHSNLIPWQMAARHTGASLRLARLGADQTLDVGHLLSLIGPRTRLVAVSLTSNVLGTVTPLGEIVARAHAVGARVVVDAAQAAAHLRFDVRALDCDFLAVSGHKLYGPTGIGALYGKPDCLEEVEPVQGGGGMIEWVEAQTARWGPLPARLEAGTPSVADAHALGAALDYLRPRMEEALRHEQRLTAYALERLLAVPGLTLFGPKKPVLRAGVFAFNLPGVHPHDAAELLDGQGVALRAGHHCCQPLMRRLGVTATLRASLAIYSSTEDVDRLVAGLSTVRAALAS
ncbi:MAG: SufS family cysteine desulfurase [Candidatus Lambdaproteobacteria bacterium]|nr:SufS family cysteine desulfurase [Candidatus Lambdaproteobacteria bacterium]